MSDVSLNEAAKMIYDDLKASRRVILLGIAQRIDDDFTTGSVEPYYETNGKIKGISSKVKYVKWITKVMDFLRVHYAIKEGGG